MLQVMCVDAGQSGTRARTPGSPVAELAPVISDEAVVPQLAERVREALRVVGPASGVAIGSSALAGTDTATELLALLAGSPLRTVWLTHDSVTNYLATLGDRPGVVVAAGTGVVTLAVGATGVARVDGWGYLVGDAGSGYWVGRAGLDAVLRAFDGRGPATALTAVVADEFPDLAEAYLVLQADDAKVTRIARYAKLVAGLAATDDVCRRICLAAAAELAHSAVSGLARVGLGEAHGVDVGLSGRLFGSAVVRDEFVRLVSQAHPAARFSEGAGGSLAGAALLPGLPAASALASRVSTARA